MFVPSRLLRIALAAFLMAAAPVAAHEFWISPDVYRLSPGDTLTAHFRVGEMFKGATRSYYPDSTERFEAGPAAAPVPVTARLGDRPALNMVVESPGLHLVVHETDDSLLTYSEWQKFVDFVAMHDLGPAIERHRDRGLPETGFRESYRRYCKALVAVGEGAGADAPQGLTVEIVLETNPYTAPPGTPMRARLYDGGRVRGDAQLEIFTRAADGAVRRSTVRSDADGLAEVPSEPGSEVLLNFVVLREREGDAEGRAPVWHSDWASLSYAVPAP